MKLTKCQTIVMETLYDVATHEGGGIVLKNKYHSPAYSLEKIGFVGKVDRGFYRPHYIITPEGLAYWSSLLTKRALDFGYCGCTYYGSEKIGQICERCGGEIRQSQ